MSTFSLIRCCQSILTFIFVSICLFILSILTYLTIQKHLMPISHLVIPISFGFPSSFNLNSDATKLPSYLVSSINLSDPMYQKSPLDIAQNTYTIELVCSSPRSYKNRQLGSVFVQLILYSTSKQIILEHSRMILYPYESQIIHLIRTFLFLPLSLFHIDYDRWKLQEVLIQRLNSHDKSNSVLETIQLNMIPSSFQLDQCSLHFHILDLTGLVYLFINYPVITGCLSIIVLFSIYMTFYLIITGLSLLNQMTKTKKIE